MEQKALVVLVKIIKSVVLVDLTGEKVGILHEISHLN